MKVEKVVAPVDGLCTVLNADSSKCGLAWDHKLWISCRHEHGDIYYACQQHVDAARQIEATVKWICNPCRRAARVVVEHNIVDRSHPLFNQPRAVALHVDASPHVCHCRVELLDLSTSSNPV